MRWMLFPASALSLLPILLLAACASLTSPPPPHPHDPHPRRIVSLPGFWIDRFLVTQRYYLAFVRSTGHRVPGISKTEYLAQGFLVHDYDREVTRFLWRDGAPPPGLEGHPVVLASAADAEAGPLFTTPVTAYPDGQSPYGLFDAAGNVFEWTASRTPDGRRVMKGAGSWDDEAGICRPAARHGRPPSSRHILFGFRCAGPAESSGP